MQQRIGLDHVVHTAGRSSYRTKPKSASTPMWAFMPKYYRLAFWLCFVCGSHTPDAFLVGLGAASSMASTTVPARSKPLAPSSSSTIARICGANLFSSGSRRNRRIVVSAAPRCSSSGLPVHEKRHVVQRLFHGRNAQCEPLLAGVRVFGR